MEDIDIVIYGDPVPQGRPRFSQSGHTYTPYMGIPTSWNKKKRMEAAQGLIRPTGKRSGDIDNLVKMIQDAGNGILWADDSIITDLVTKKRYTAELARVEITATEVQE